MLYASWNRPLANLSQLFARQAVGIKEVHDEIWLVNFMDYDLPYFDLETLVLERSKMPSAQKCYLCSRYENWGTRSLRLES
jgi:putative transposase